MRCYRKLIRLIIALCLTGCSDTTWNSSVPLAQVNLRIDTRLGEFVHFVPANIYSYVEVDKNGWYLNGKYLQARQATEVCGYAGVLICIDMNGSYCAYDLCCPNCVHQTDHRCEVSSGFATCPHCGEVYDTGMGYGFPTKGICKEGLKRYTTIVANGVITVHN